MRKALLVPIALAAGAAVMPAAAQVTVRTMPRTYAYSFNSSDSPRAVIGVTMSTGDAQDTLGIRISEVAAGSPAEKAGIVEGDRLQAINGVNLRISTIDVGDQDMADAMSRRLTRELGKLKPGDEVSLRVYHDGQAKTVSVKTVNSNDLYDTGMGTMMRREEKRAAIGVSLMSTGSKRDTLGVLIVGVSDDGPAAKAGLEEGNRIAGINGVDLKVDRADAGDSYVSSARYERLQKELAKVKPGDDVTLQVYADGHFKTVHVKTVDASSLHGSGNTIIFNRGGDGQGMNLDLFRDGEMPAMNLRIDGQQVRDQVRQAMEKMRQSMESLRENQHLRWMNDDDMPEMMHDMMPAMVNDMPPAPPAPAMAPMAPMAPAMPDAPHGRIVRAAMVGPAAAPVVAPAVVGWSIRAEPPPPPPGVRAPRALGAMRVIRF